MVSKALDKKRQKSSSHQHWTMWASLLNQWKLTGSNTDERSLCKLLWTLALQSTTSWWKWRSSKWTLWNANWLETWWKFQGIRSTFCRSTMTCISTLPQVPLPPLHCRMKTLWISLNVGWTQCLFMFQWLHVPAAEQYNGHSETHCLSTV